MFVEISACPYLLQCVLASVKQGGLLSPALFALYIDRLKVNIGKYSTGQKNNVDAFGYSSAESKPMKSGTL